MGQPDIGSICMIKNGSGTESRGAEIKFPPGSGSFLFTRDFKKFYRKIIVVYDVFVNCYTILILLLKSKKELFKVSYKTISGART